MVAAVFRTIVVPPDPATAGRFPTIGTLMDNTRPRCSRSPGPPSALAQIWSMAQRNPTSDTDTTAAIDSGA
jgi:hypothetical protein